TLTDGAAMTVTETEFETGSSHPLWFSGKTTRDKVTLRLEVGAFYAELVAPGNRSHGPVVSGADCQRQENTPEPPEGVAVTTATPPRQTLVLFTAILTIGSARTTTVTTLDAGSLQPEDGSVIRYL